MKKTLFIYPIPLYYIIIIILLLGQPGRKAQFLAIRIRYNKNQYKF